jgi:pimeloyl-ACP methyl ester carboxylesterase
VTANELERGRPTDGVRGCTPTGRCRAPTRRRRWDRRKNAAGARRLLAAIPTAEWREIEDSGHRLLADAGPRVAEIVADWLDA